MKILLFDPPGQATTQQFFPLGLMYLQASLKRAGYAQTSIRRLNSLDRRTITAQLADLEPDVVGITCLSGNHGQTFALARTVKEYDGRIKVVLGGHHATHLCQQVLEAYPCVDVVVRGEGEVTFKELIDAFGSGRSCASIAGVSSRDADGKVVHGPDREQIVDLDGLPFPCYDDMHATCRQADSFPILVSRGCPFACVYCSATRYYGHLRRQRSVANIVEELRWIKQAYAPRKVLFYDDFLTADIQHAHELFERIVQEDLGFRFMAQTRFDHLDEALLVKMKKAGVEVLCFGLETGSERILMESNRPFSRSTAFEMVRAAEKVGIKTKAKLVLGWPGEHWQDVVKTAKVLCAMAPYIFQVLPLVIMPGTALYDRVKQAGDVSDRFWLEEKGHLYYLGLKRGLLGKPLFHLGALFLMVAFFWRTRSIRRLVESVVLRVSYEISCSKIYFSNLFLKK